MKLSSNVIISLLILVFGGVSYALERFMEPVFGRVWCEAVSAAILLALTLFYLWVSSQEKDERERELRQQADSISLYALVLGLLGAAVFDRQMDMEGFFWTALGLIAGGRIIACLYQKYHK